MSECRLEYIAEKSIAVVGAGYWGKNLVRNFHLLGALQAIHDADSAVVDALTARFPGTEKAASFGQVLADPRIKGVAIATPAVTHAALVREALVAGKDVYVEKPLCLSEPEAVALSRLAADHHRVLMVGHLLWYHSAILKLKELIRTGALGQIKYVYSNRLNLGKLRREENVLWSFAPHDVSVILGLLGEMPEAVQAQGGNYLHRHIADTTVSLLDFPSGVRAHIFVSWLHPYKEQKLVVVGDRQMAVFDDTLPWQEKLQLFPHSISWSNNLPSANKAEAVKVALQEEEPLLAECRHFLDCLTSRQTPRTDGWEGVRVLQVLNACQAALDRHTAVAVQTTPPPPPPAPEWYAHPTAEVDPDVIVGKGTKIWHFSHLLEGSRVGANCNIGQNCVVGPRVTIGTGCKIQNNVSVYTGVTLEDYVFCGPSMVFTNVFNPRAHTPRKHEYRPTLVKEGCTIGANATIVCGCTLGRHSLVGAGAVVTRDVPDHAMVVGVPARLVGWVCYCGVRLDEAWSCPACGRCYQPKPSGDGLTEAIGK